MKEIKEFIDKHVAMLPVGNSVSFTQYETKAGDFLTALAKIADFRHIFSEDKIRLTSTHIAVYAEQMAKGTAKTVTENKLIAEASPEYIKAREDLESMENNIVYLKTFNDIFTNAHVLYRQLSKGENA